MKRLNYLCLVGLLFVSAASAAPLYHITTLGLDDPEHTNNGGFKTSFASQPNELGQVTGSSYRWNGGSTLLGSSAWFYNGTTTIKLGFTGPEYTLVNDGKSSGVAEMNQAGQVLGVSERYLGSYPNNPGYSAWLYNGTTTIELGLPGPEYTSSRGFRYTRAYHLNEAGQVAGWSQRYNNGGGGVGAWLYNGTTTIELGFTGPEYTGNDGYKFSSPNTGPNEAGQVSGYSQRMSGGGGRSAWLYDGATTIDIGLTGSEHTRNDGYRYSTDGSPNEAGQVSGSSTRYNGGSTDLGTTAWLYDGATTIDIGLTGAEHTRNDGYRSSIPNFDGPNEAGQVIGTSRRYNGGSADLGRTAWLYNGATTTEIGLTGSEHTRNDGYKRSQFAFVDGPLNNAGQVLGYSNRYNGGSTQLGQSLWLYNGATTIAIGLSGPEHTRNDGYKYSDVIDNIVNRGPNEAGQVLGYSELYNGGSTKLGQSVWLYNGTTTIDIGLTGPEYSGSGGSKYSEAQAWNKAGQVSGYSYRYSGCPCVYGSSGQSAWLYDGATTIELGFTGPEYTRSDGYRASSASGPNEAGQVTGYSQRFSGSTSLGQDAWFYDPTLHQTFPLRLSTRSDGYAYSSAYVAEDGVVWGFYTLFDALDNDLGSRDFYFTIADGLHDLGSLVDGGLTANGWDYLGSYGYGSYPRANGHGQITGVGKLTSQSGGQMAYLLTPIAVPEPSTFILAAAALGLVVCARRRPRHGAPERDGRTTTERPAFGRIEHSSCPSDRRLAVASLGGSFFSGLRHSTTSRANGYPLMSCAKPWLRRVLPQQAILRSIGIISGFRETNRRPRRMKRWIATIFPHPLGRTLMKRSTYLCLVALLLASAAPARADIFQWEYINPGNPGLGKQQVATLCPDGAGVNAVPFANFYSRNLTKAYLIGSDLTYTFGNIANLTDADLGSAILLNSRFDSANLTGANLSQANLMNSSFESANLTGANLSQANFNFAYFQNATLTGVNLTGADVRGANFSRDDGNGGTGLTPAQLYSTASYAARDFSIADPNDPYFAFGISLGGNNLAGINLADQNLRGADFSYATLTDANLSQANLGGANLWSTNLTGAQLNNADLRAILYEAVLTNANLHQANLSNSQVFYTNLTNADLSQANLSGTQFSQATLTGANFAGAEVRGASFDGSGFTTTQLFSTASYVAHDLTGTGLPGVNLTGVNFAGFNLNNASFNGATLTGADFAGANVKGANFGGSNFTLAQLTSTASYPAHDLGAINLDNINLAGASLSGQNLVGSHFSSTALNGANLSQSNLSNAYLASANLTNANLNQANLSNAILFSATLTGADVRGANFTGDINDDLPQNISAVQLTSTSSYAAHDLTGIILDNNSLGEVNFTGQNLSHASLQGAGLRQLNGANLTQANLTDANLHSGTLTNATLAQTNLTNAALGRSNLTNANLNQANLTGAGLSAAKLTGANLTGAEVRGANFSKGDYESPFDNYYGTGITAAQLTSTASYAAHDLTGIVLPGHILTGVNFAGFNLTNVNFGSTALNGANLSQSNLTGANFTGADLTGAILSGADVRGTSFVDSPGFTAAQLYSTASYLAHDLTGISLHGNDLTGWNFAGQNLTNAGFASVILANANLSQANLSNATLRSSNLTGANFSQANLTNANFIQANLNSANLAGAEVRGANFDYTGLTSAQLYATASYLAHDLTGINLSENDLTGWNFAGQNLTNSGFVAATLIGANLSQANLTNANFVYANLNSANLAGAEARGANFDFAMLSGANTSNLIQSNGHIAGLNLSAGATLVVRDYDGNPYYGYGPLPIVVDQHLAMGAGGTLRMVFEADAWDSTVSFANGIPVTRGGTLELTFADGMSLTSQIGRTFDVFNWTGVTPTGAFNVASPNVWDLSKLYTTGEIMFAAAAGLPGDFNGDNVVDAADYVVWRKGLSTATYTQAAYNVWRSNFGATLGAGSGAALPSAEPLSPAVPEPCSLMLAAVAGCGLVMSRRRRAT